MMLVPRSPQSSNGTRSSSQDPYILMAAATMYRNGHLTEEQKAGQSGPSDPQMKLAPRVKSPFKSGSSPGQLPPEFYPPVTNTVGVRG